MQRHDTMRQPSISPLHQHIPIAHSHAWSHVGAFSAEDSPQMRPSPQQGLPQTIPTFPNARPFYAQHRVRASMVPFSTSNPLSLHAINGQAISGPPIGMVQGQSFSGGPRNRRTQSISIGGPPKAVLGGPSKKMPTLSPIAFEAVADNLESATLSAVTTKSKKIAVNLPRENSSMTTENGQIIWKRAPLFVNDSHGHIQITAPNLTTALAYPADVDCKHIPNKMDVYLPGKQAWQALRFLNIPRPQSGLSNHVSIIHAPHARAASISSPADSALLIFKLNKLHQSMPSESRGGTPSPLPFQVSYALNPASMPFVPSKYLQTGLNSTHTPRQTSSSFISSPELDHLTLMPERETVGLTQAEKDSPVDPISQTNPQADMGGRSSSRPNFTIGFGLETTEEEDDSIDESRHEIEPQLLYTTSVTDAEQDQRIYGARLLPVECDNANKIGDSQIDSHLEAQKWDNTLLYSGGADRPGVLASLHSRDISEASSYAKTGIHGRVQSIAETKVTRLSNRDEAADWTGSEDQAADVVSADGVSIGEWSNPSDEERARHNRLQRRQYKSTAKDVEVPRRIPAFPHPPGHQRQSVHYRDDDLLSNPSNPSEDGIQDGKRDVFHVEVLPNSNVIPGLRPLPPLPHSRNTSKLLDQFDPSLAHSRAESNDTHYVSHLSKGMSNSSLNPYAQPFIFGGVSHETSKLQPQTLRSSPAAHSRSLSLGRPLNATAPSFTPGHFSFRPPPGVPHLNFVPELLSRPLPEPPTDQSPARAQQGREKRQKRDSVETVTTDSQSPGNEAAFSSFKFPRPSGSSDGARQQASAPQILQDFSENDSEANMLLKGKSVPLSNSSQGSPQDKESMESDVVTHREHAISGSHTPPPSSMHIPLDFSLPATSNTVPASLFKGLVHITDEKTVRSRLNLQDTRRDSLDDGVMPKISLHSSRSQRIITVQDAKRTNHDTFSPLSGDNPLSDGLTNPISESPLSRHNIAQQSKQEQWDELLYRMESIMEDKIERLKDEMLLLKSQSGISQETDIKMSEVLSIFRNHITSSVGKDASSGHLTVPSTQELQEIKAIAEEQHSVHVNLIRQEFNDLRELVQSIALPSMSSFFPVLDELHHRTTGSPASALSQVPVIVQPNHDQVALAKERELLVSEIIAVLRPIILENMDRVDYDHLTQKLTQAVKPHITQLIDFASDKRETASLIIEQLVPLLPSIAADFPDTTTLSAQFLHELQRLVNTIDTHEIKEQVADLVVERLDSRLSLRDQSFTSEMNADKFSQRIMHLLQPSFTAIQGCLGDVSASIPQLNSLESLLSKEQIFGHASSDVLQAISSNNQSILSVKDLVNAMSKSNHDVCGAVQQLETATKDASMRSQNSGKHVERLVSLHQDMLDRLMALPDTFIAATSILQSVQNDIDRANRLSEKNASEHKSHSLDLQAQLTRMQDANTQMRLENEHFQEKLSLGEAERDSDKQRIHELEQSLQRGQSTMHTFTTVNADLEKALSKTLQKLEDSIVAAQSQSEHWGRLERNNMILQDTQQAHMLKVEALEDQLKMLNSKLGVAIETSDHWQKEHSRLLSQQNHWDDLRRTAEQVEMLTTLIGQADNEELRDLRRIRDHSRALESEHAALLKRFKDQEIKISNSERVSFTARQSLAQAQQRASDWEKRAKEHELSTESFRAKWQKSEDLMSQQAADLKLCLEQKDVDDRAAQDQEARLKEQIKSLELQLQSTQNEMQTVKTQLNQSSPPRPDSRSGTAYGQTSLTSLTHDPRSMDSSRSNTPPTHLGSSTHDSFFTPHSSQLSNKMPRYSHGRARLQEAHFYNRAASPAFSIISATPTQREDGWWE